MPVLSKDSAAPGMALTYITIGSLMTIWAAVWYFAFAPQNRVAIGLCLGLFLSGLAFLVIGFCVGRIGRQAREAELPPTDPATAAIQKTVHKV